ncbi:zeta toxin family protein [Rhodopirellula bahusiensis]|uniref:zeta toxin family protein n=1 Tax=Rhodopirellula bahusiensis TaxID=2014065 RepID=UPI003266EC82
MAGNSAFEILVPDRLSIRTSNLTSYQTSWLASYLRDRLIDEGKSLATESVMSHSSKIDLLKRSKRAGYRNYLYFVATSDEEINLNRVRLRVNQGGHDVPEQKIRARYHRSIGLLREALLHVYRGYIFDNSGPKAELIAERTPQGTVELRSETIPQWFADAVWNQ